MNMAVRWRGALLDVFVKQPCCAISRAGSQKTAASSALAKNFPVVSAWDLLALVVDKRGAGSG
jgi:hypothetical protein